MSDASAVPIAFRCPRGSVGRNSGDYSESVIGVAENGGETPDSYVPSVPAGD